MRCDGRAARKPSSNGAREALGHPIEIVSAWRRRASSTSASRTPCRRVRAGGWSATSAAAAPKSSSAKALEPLEMESLQIGCVRVSEEFFADGRLSQKRMQRARVAARQAIEAYQASFRRRGWDEAVGSSGTVRAIGDCIRELDPAVIDYRRGRARTH
jgi:exopolyphosphatase/guanosine-5'-triphosphate,3'-diphosphate pyrophosphatase